MESGIEVGLQVLFYYRLPEEEQALQKNPMCWTFPRLGKPDYSYPAQLPGMDIKVHVYTFIYNLVSNNLKNKPQNKPDLFRIKIP